MGRIATEGGNNDKTRNKKLVLKNNPQFRSYISKTNDTRTKYKTRI